MACSVNTIRVNLSSEAQRYQLCGWFIVILLSTVFLVLYEIWSVEVSLLECVTALAPNPTLPPRTSSLSFPALSVSLGGSKSNISPFYMSEYKYEIQNVITRLFDHKFSLYLQAKQNYFLRFILKYSRKPVLRRRTPFPMFTVDPISYFPNVFRPIGFNFFFPLFVSSFCLLDNLLHNCHLLVLKQEMVECGC